MSVSSAPDLNGNSLAPYILKEAVELALRSLRFEAPSAIGTAKDTRVAKHQANDLFVACCNKTIKYQVYRTML